MKLKENLPVLIFTLALLIVAIFAVRYYRLEYPNYKLYRAGHYSLASKGFGCSIPITTGKNVAWACLTSKPSSPTRVLTIGVIILAVGALLAVCFAKFLGKKTAHHPET